MAAIIKEAYIYLVNPTPTYHTLETLLVCFVDHYIRLTTVLEKKQT